MRPRPAARLAELRLALMLMTRLPAGRLAEPVPGAAEAGWALPLTGLAVGLPVWAVLAAAAALGVPPASAALLGFGAAVLLTGGLHHDGLADFADGLGGATQARRLEIMRDSRIGSYGVLALLVASGLVVAGMAGAPQLSGLLLVALASRWLMLAALVLLPPARPDGLGRMAGGVAPRALWPGGAATLAVALWAGPAALPVLAVMGAVALILGALARRRLGGQTGDVLGAVQLATEAAGWTALLAVAG
ncbi:adenosylcobinamide-GDP ribazoletransferase [Roseivivax sp. CAU 1761]